MFTRRALLVNSSAAAISNLIGSACAQTVGQRIRFNAASPEGKKMLRIYAAGVKMMKALSAQDPHSWQFQWYIHATPAPVAQIINSVYPGGTGATFGLASATWYTCQAHLGQPEDYFLPWHRLYVLQFEQIIRDITGRDEFTLPYWDYTSPTSYAIPDEFQAKNSNDPLFSSLFVSHRNKDGGQLRSADVNAGEPLNKHYAGVRNFLVLPTLKGTGYSSFCNQLDSNLHGDIHVFTGDATNMGTVPTAAGDPVFWLHHCNIDRIWAAWSASGGKTPSSTNGNAWSSTYFGFPGAGLQPVQTAISSVADISTLPYKYDTLPGVPAGALIAAAASHMEVLSRSTRADADLSASAGETGSPPIPLGSTPSKVRLAPSAKQNRLLAVVPGLEGTARITILLKDVQARTDPNTVYQVYLDLPDKPTPELEEEHYVGLLNFFGVAPAPGHEIRGGRDVEFDITDLAKRLQTTSTLQDETSVTLVPVGSPSESSLPTINGGISLLRR
jgi:tyrosinase